MIVRAIHQRRRSMLPCLRALLTARRFALMWCVIARWFVLAAVAELEAYLVSIVDNKVIGKETSAEAPCSNKRAQMR